jgi:cytochrome c oxidase assembly factor CtaG
MIAGSAVSAYMVFSETVLYLSYQQATRIFPLSPIDDQAAAGGLMWFAMTIAFLVPAVVIMIRYLSPARPRAAAHRVAATSLRAS